MDPPHPFTFLRFLHSSTAAETLTHLIIGYCKIDQQFIDGLGRFRNSRHLQLQDIRQNELALQKTTHKLR